MTTKITEKNISSLANVGVNWQAVVVADGSTGLTAVAGRGYFIDTTSGTITVTFPASPTAGDTIVINDYASTFATNNVTINFNGNKLEADTTNAILSTNDQTHTFVFTDATQGWKIVNQDTGSSIQPLFISATGGTVTTSGNFKIHSFTGDGCFVVATVGNPAGGGSNVDYLVVAGGGAGCTSGGGGGGGFREGKSSAAPSYTASPLVAPSGLPVSVTTYPVTVGSGGTYSSPGTATSGSNSVFSTITSNGGGYGGGNKAASSGGSGGGGTYNPSYSQTEGSGNTPPTSPPQGNAGQSGIYVNGNTYAGGGGGGATTAGVNRAPNRGGDGGAGATTSISGTSSSFSGGGGGKGFSSCSPNDGLGGLGGGANSPNIAGTANTGGGGSDVNNGGKGIIIIRYKFQN